MIRSTFAGFTTAQLAMAASQKALDVTGQNIANINTVGYTRQRLDIASLNTNGGNFYSSGNKTKVGFGVEMTGISQLRDPFLDMQYRSQMSKLGTTDARAAGLEQLEPIFDETMDDGIRDALRNITSALTTLANNPSGQEYDGMVRSNMQIFLNLLHDNASRLEDVRADVVNGFESSDVADVNRILENIANLNINIKNSQILDNPALELQDERNDLLDELASYLPISVKYSDREVGPGVFVEVLDVTFVDTNGDSHQLISDGKFSSFEADITGEPVTLKLDSLDGSGTINVTDVLGSGTLKGTLDVINKSGDFDNSDFKGIGYYEKSLDALVETFVTVFNDLNKGVKLDANGEPIKNPNYDPADPTKGPEYELEDRPLFEKINPAEPWSASNVKIADDWTNGTYGVTNSTNVIGGKVPSDASETIMSMIESLSRGHEFSVNGVKFYEGSFYDCFANIENTLATDIKAAEAMLKNQISVVNQTANSKDAVSGVQLDEEGMNLMHFNQSYTAAARLMTTLDEALDTLINRTGVVGR